MADSQETHLRETSPALETLHFIFDGLEKIFGGWDLGQSLIVLSRLLKTAKDSSWPIHQQLKEFIGAKVSNSVQV